MTDRAPGGERAGPRPDLDQVRTQRLLLRRIRPDDLPHLLRYHADPVGMEALGGVRSEAETIAYVEAQLEHWARHGFGWWIAFDRASGAFAGRGGVRMIPRDGELLPEVGYGLLPEYWGRGLGTELARAAVWAGLEALRLPRLIALATASNTRSRRVLEKTGFHYVRDTVHKGLPHLLYERLPALETPGGVGPLIGL